MSDTLTINIEEVPQVFTINLQEAQNGPPGPPGPAGMQGPQGPQGFDGITPQLRASGTALEASQDDGTTWDELIDLADLAFAPEAASSGSFYHSAAADSADGHENEFPVLQIGDSFGLGAMIGFESRAAILGSVRSGVISRTNATLTIDDYALSPDGRYDTIQNGGNVVVGHLQTGTDGPVDYVWITLMRGTGSAVIQYSTNGGSSWVSAGANINTTSIAIGAVQVTRYAINYSPTVRVRMTASGGVVNGWLGQSRRGTGVLLADFATNGQDTGQVANIGEAAWKGLIGGYGIKWVYCAFADSRYTAVTSPSWPKGTEAWAAGGPIDTLHTWSKQQTPTIDWLVVGPHRPDPARLDGVDAVLDPLYAAMGLGRNTFARMEDGRERQRSWAQGAGQGFFDAWGLFPDFALASAFYADDIHLSSSGKAVRRAALFSKTGLGPLIGDTSNRTLMRMGPLYLYSGTLRSSWPTLWVGTSPYKHNNQAAIGAAAFRIGEPLANGDENAAMQWTSPSINVARLGNLTTTGWDFSFVGSGGTMVPGTSIGSAVGSSSSRVNNVWATNLDMNGALTLSGSNEYGLGWVEAGYQHFNIRRLTNGTRTLMTVGNVLLWDSGTAIFTPPRVRCGASSRTAPGYSLQSATSTGLHIANASNVELVVNGSLKFAAVPSGAAVTGDLEVSGMATLPQVVSGGGPISEATTSRTMALTDVGRLVRFSNSGAITVSIPQQATVAWPEGAILYFRRNSGAGAITLGGSGVTINENTSGSIPAGGLFAVRRVATDEWDFV